MNQFVPGFPLQFGDTLGRFAHPALQAGGVSYGEAVSVDLGSGTTVGTSATIGPLGGGRAYWQQASGSPNFADTNLADNSGAATTLDLTLTDASGNNNTRAVDDGGSEFDMFTRGFGSAGTGTPATLTIAEIPYTNYDIVVCIEEHSSSGSGKTLAISDGATTFYAITQETARWNGSWAPITSESSGSPDTAGNYAVFENLSGASQVLTFTPDTSGSGFVITGLQIIERV